MTLIELFDSQSMDNVLASLAHRPQKIIYLGKKEAVERRLTLYRSFLSQRGIRCPVLCAHTDTENPEAVTAALDEIVSKEDSCVIELTGGDDLALVAAGRIAERYPRKVTLSRSRYPEIQISVEELVMLYGGKVTSFQGAADPLLSRQIWSICRKNPENWNLCVNRLNTALIKDKDLTYRFHGSLGRKVTTLLLELEKKNILTLSEQSLRFLHKQAPALILKAGTPLEMKLLHLALDSPLYGSALSGVTLDWDARCAPPDTSNEVDLILTQGSRPVFISCKNGKFDESELYKLQTVASRFGGIHARKAIFAASMDSMPPQRRTYLHARARDMDIQLITGIHRLSDPAIRKKLEQVGYPDHPAEKEKP